jgi:signal transduction histidine kinase/CheY-like chemotaxis protein
MAGLLAAVAVLGYGAHLPSLIHIRPGLKGMSPLTATAILALAGAAFASAGRRRRRVLAGAAIAILAAASTLAARLLSGADTASLFVGTGVFRLRPDDVGTTSLATALTVILIAASLMLRRKPVLADLAAGAGLLVSGVAVLGYFYGITDLYALPMFNSMALNTALALLLLSVAALLAAPASGCAAILCSEGLGGGPTRRQLAAIVLPILVGKLLLLAVAAGWLGPAVAMALLVIVTVAPLAILILRDGQVLNALDRERRDRARMQDRLAADMAVQLAQQATDLAHESDERARAEAAMHRSQRMEAVGELTGGIAHDFNNLLMAIRGNLEMLQIQLPAADQHLAQYIENAIAAAGKGAKVTAQLLAFSRRQLLDIRSVELEPVLTSARALLGNALGPCIGLDMRLNSPGACVRTDPDQLELAILNLVVNARDAMPDGGHIRIESQRCRQRLAQGDPVDCVAIRVIDNGVGMSPDVAAHAVEPFFTTKARGKGTGLGLAQVYGFVNQCGGELHITSTPGKGTIVEILLRTQAPVQAAPLPPAAAATTRALPARGRKVLVIDDDDGVRGVIVDALLAAGFDVAEARDGESGLAMLEGVDPALAVIDFLMPGMNGAEVAKKAQQRRPGLPIVFVSGYADTKALDGIAGAVVLRKPFDLDGLDRAVRSVMV